MCFIKNRMLFTVTREITSGAQSEIGTAMVRSERMGMCGRFMKFSANLSHKVSALTSIWQKQTAEVLGHWVRVFGLAVYKLCRQTCLPEKAQNYSVSHCITAAEKGWMTDIYSIDSRHVRPSLLGHYLPIVNHNLNPWVRVLHMKIVNLPNLHR